MSEVISLREKLAQAELAAQVGMGFAFAHHFATHDAIAAMTNYRARFRPSGWRTTPQAILAVAASKALSRCRLVRTIS